MKEKDFLVQTIVEGLQEKKAQKIVVVDMTGIEDAAYPYFIVCEGRSTTHVSSIADTLIQYVRKEAGVKPYAHDGYTNCQWVAVDYGYALVHIFLPEYREFYNIETLWAKSKLRAIPDLD